MTELIALLDSGGYSCVIAKGVDIRSFTRRGVADLYYLLRSDPDFLRGASVADKVVGKGAAALMISGGVKRLYSHVISEGALALFSGSDVEVEYGRRVPHIINRDGSGWCPVERLCCGVDRVDEIIPLLDEFVSKVVKI
ncbi:MAG: DUF1893 domain-containing protein [Rikenellaceae bacterium]